MITLVSSDDIKFTVDWKYYDCVGGLLKTILEDFKKDDNVEIPLEIINSSTLQRVVRFIELSTGNPLQEIPKPLPSSKMSDNITQQCFVEFIDNLNSQELVDLINAFNYMSIQSGVNLAAAKIASLIKDKSPQEIKNEFPFLCN